jgi:hypothetical protein
MLTICGVHLSWNVYRVALQAVGQFVPMLCLCSIVCLHRKLPFSLT